MLALGSFDDSTAQNTTVRQDTLKGAGLNGPQNRGNPGRWCQSHKRPLPSIGNLLSAEVPTDVWFTDESGATKKVSYIKIKADERGSAIIRSLTPLPTSNELNRSPESTLIPYHLLSLVSFTRSAADAVGGCNVGRQNCSVNPITTGLIDLIFSKRLKTFHDTPLRSPFFARNRRGRTQMRQPAPTPAPKSAKKSLNCKKTTENHGLTAPKLQTHSTPAHYELAGTVGTRNHLTLPGRAGMFDNLFSPFRGAEH
jgi:hypothetical protein